MTNSQTVKALHAQARELAESVLGVAERSHLGDELVAAVETALRRVEDAVATPVTVGFVGQFTSGKSSLLGVLLGDPALLPATNNATTGNVTAIRPMLRSGDVPTRVVEPVSVRFFDSASLAACRKAMAGELAADARKYNLPGPEGADWETLTAWCQNTVWPVPDLQVKVCELMALRDAALSYPWLVAGAALELDWHTVRTALLPIMGRPAGYTPVWSLPAARPMPGTGGIDAVQLRLTMPLVHRVMITVEVSARYWPLDRDQLDDDVVLLDFPGRGASPSEMRDEFLLDSELPHLNTLMVLLDPERPDSSDPNRIRMKFDQLDHVEGLAGPVSRADGVLALISRFDRLTESAPDLLSSTGPLRVTDLLDHARLPGLRALWREAERATARSYDRMSGATEGNNSGDSVAIVSVATAWALGADRNQSPPIHTPPGRDVQEWRNSLAEIAGHWGRLAARIPGGLGIAGPLGEYAEDGGLGRLRRLITQHAERNGLAQKASRVHAALQQLRVLAGEALDVLDAAKDREHAKENAHRDSFRALVGAVKHELSLSQKRCAVDVFSPQFALSNGRTGVAEIKRAVTAHVFAWREWERLLDAVSDGMIRPGQRPLPVTTGDFAARFAETVDIARDTGVRVADAIMLSWLAGRGEELAGWMGRLKEYLNGADSQLYSKHAPMIKQFGRAVQVGWLANLEVPGNTSLSSVDDVGFPLRTERALPWHPARCLGEDDAIERHQIYVMRLRNEMTASAVRAGQSAMAHRLRQRSDAVHKALTDLVEQWPGPHELNECLDTAFGPVRYRRRTPRDITTPLIPIDEELGTHGTGDPAR